MEKQLHICHISVLNPAIHSRIFFKMALAQAAAGYKVSIIAQDAASAPYMREGVTIIPIKSFGRLSFRRLFNRKKIRRLALALKADFYQLHTVELLGLGKQIKAYLPQAKIVWDMHEDYVANILYADYYAKYLQKILIKKVRKAQNDFCAWGDGLILAEECFEGLLDFPSSKTVIIRNKYQAPEKIIRQKAGGLPEGIPIMVYTGTIAENWGIFRVLELWEMLRKRRALGLIIAGHSQDTSLLENLDEYLLGNLEVLCIGGGDYVPYEEIVGCIQQGTVGLALYDLKENIKDRIPTKFYELMGNNKPVIFTSNPKWNALNDRLNFGLGIDWPPTEAQLDEIEKRFLTGAQTSPIPTKEWSWETEKSELISFYQRI